MYVARFETEDGDWVQAAALLRCTALSGSSVAQDWWDEVARRCSAASRIERATIARRILLDDARRLRQLVVISAPAAAEPDVRLVFAGLTRLERLLGGSIEVAATRGVHDEWLADVPPLRYSPLDDVFTADGRAVACDFRIAPSLDDLLAEAALVNRALVYQVHARGYHAGVEEVRAARRGALQLSQARGAPAQVVELQERLSAALSSASSLVEEYLAVDSDAAAGSAGALLYERFRAEHPALASGTGPPRFARDAHDQEITVAVHRHDLEALTPVELSAAALSPAERDRMIAWRPSPRVASLLQPDDGIDGTLPDEAEQERPPDVPLPPPYTGDGAFAFVSYKRADLPRIAPIIEMVQRLGVPVWYDRGIPGASEWDEVIEDRVSRCRFVLFFASSAAVQSKYVRREVKFADARNTPLLSVLLEDAQLLHGMAMLLTQYQMLDARAPDFATRLRQAVGGLA